MSYYQDVYWWGSILQGTMMIALLLNMWRKKDCSGISLRTQILYALVFSTRHVDLGRWRVPGENYAFKAAYLTVTYGTVLSMWKWLSNSYDKQYDTARIEIWTAVCFVLSLIFRDRFDFLEILMAFSLYTEAVAMIAQFQFTLNSKRIDKHVTLYIAGMGLYALIQVIFLCYQNSWYSNRNNGFQIVAATTQFLPYCEFFRRIYPMMGPSDDEIQGTTCYERFYYKIRGFLLTEKPQDVEADNESEAPKTGHLASNVSSVVLTPSSLAGVHKDKEPFVI